MAVTQFERDHAWLAAIVTSSDDAIVSKNLDGIITSWNEGAERLFGYTADEVIGRPVTLLLPEDRSDEEPRILERIRRGKRVPRYETVRRRKDGSLVDVSITVSPVVGSDGRVLGASKIARDITQRRQAEEQLRRAETHYRGLAELLPVGVCACDAPDGTVTYFNAAATAIWGREPQPGDTVRQLCASVTMFRAESDEAIPPERCPMSTALREGRGLRNQEVLIERADGSRVTVLINIEVVRSVDGTTLGTINAFHDVTTIKQTEAALREQTAELQTLLDIVPIPVFLADDPECRRISGNRAAATMLRIPLGANLWKSASPGEEPPFTLLRDGEPLPPERLPVQRAARGEVVGDENLDIVLDDGETLHVRISARPLFDASGAPRGAIACMLDLTDLTRSARALKEADRRKDEFLATLSHELRNPLAPILTGLEIMRRVDDPEALTRTQHTMERQVHQLVRLVDDLLDVSRITRGTLRLRPARTELSQVVDDAVDASRPAIDNAGHLLIVELPEKAVAMEADPDRLTQILSNLLHNAAAYTPHGGRIELKGERHEGDVVLSVTDDGIGIAAPMLDQIFDMFSQTGRSHERGHTGLGVGLTLARRFAEMHGGALEAHSGGPGEGSTFTLRLPIHRPESVHEIQDEDGDPRASGITRRVLVVDDNEAFVETISLVVGTLGHDVRSAQDGRAAVEMAETFRPDVVLMDLGMPGMSGYEAARRIRDLPWGRGVKLVALTGWGQEADIQRSREAGFDHHLVKPAKIADLERLLAT